MPEIRFQEIDTPIPRPKPRWKTQPLPPLEDGLHEGVPFDDYKKREGLNKSTAFGAARQSMAHLRYALDHAEDKQTPDTRLGTMLHARVLEPDRFWDEFLTVAKIPGKPLKDGKPGKPKELLPNSSEPVWQRAEALHPGRLVMAPGQLEQIDAMAKQIEADKEAVNLLRGGRREVSLFWRELGGRVVCKGRIDHIRESKNVIIPVDLKKCQDASDAGMEKAVYNFGHYMAAAVYGRGLNKLLQLGYTPQLMLVFVEDTPPYAINIVEIDVAAIEQGWLEYERVMRMFVACSEVDHWPPYRDTNAEVGSVSVPPYRLTDRIKPTILLEDVRD